VKDEIALLYLIVCVCGWMGKVTKRRQSLVVHGKRLFDEIMAECQECGRTYKLYFDVTDVNTPFGRLGDSAEALKRFDMEERSGESEDEF
jgi:hypothetical protein